MPAYDSNLFYPPAPLAKVSLKNFDKGNAVSGVPMLIDSGADITLIPAAYVDELNADTISGESYELQGFDGHRSLAQSVHLDLVFLDRTFRRPVSDDKFRKWHFGA
jgi:hypothetical protein